MTQQHSEPADTPASVEERQVLEFLRENPDLLRRHPDTLAALDIPHQVGDGARSLIEYQVALLRQESRQLATRLDELLLIARDNDRLAEQLHRFTLELLAADDLEGVLVSLRDGLRQDFRADVVSVHLVGRDLPTLSVPVLDPDDPEAMRLEEHFPGSDPVLGSYDAGFFGPLFEADIEAPGSVAVIPLDESPLRGFVAIGSRDPERYTHHQGTVFLSQLGSLVARILRRALHGEAR